MSAGSEGCPRREFLGWVVSGTVLSGVLAACRQRPHMPGQMQPGVPPSTTQSMPHEMPDWMMSQDGMTDPGLAREIPVIQSLLTNHRDIVRRVEDFSYGIKATTTSTHPEIAEHIRTHVEQMQARLQRGAPIRQLDPLFAEIFKYPDRIDLQIDFLPNGVRVSETSHDPLTVMLIRQHAHRAVSEFVAAGMNRAVRPTPLPPGYHR